MAEGAKSDRATDVACPFCGLICDDLEVEAGPSGLRVTANGCPRAIAGFERPVPEDAPRVAGEATSLDQATARAAAILAASRLPLFAGLGTDVAGLREVLALADALGGAVDHLGSRELFRNLRILQDDGWMTTTLSEVRNRVDLLLVVGGGVPSQFPRFFERCVWPKETLFGGDVRQRQVVLLGVGEGDVAAATEAAKAARAAVPVSIPCDPAGLPAAVASLRALLNGRQAAGGTMTDALANLARRMKETTYGVVAWTAAGLDGPAGELTVGVIADIVRDLNRKTRFSGLPLAGADNGIGANQVCTWQTGMPLRTGFGRGYPEHDHWRFDAVRLAESGETDAILWISSFRDDDMPFGGAAPVVALAMPGTRFARDPEVFIPVATPGVDHAGQVFRTDGVVTLPVRGLRESAPPTVASVVAGLRKAIAASRGSERRAG